jgi:hypothetical protein
MWVLLDLYPQVPIAGFPPAAPTSHPPPAPPPSSKYARPESLLSLYSFCFRKGLWLLFFPGWGAICSPCGSPLSPSFYLPPQGLTGKDGPPGPKGAPGERVSPYKHQRCSPEDPGLGVTRWSLVFTGYQDGSSESGGPDCTDWAAAPTVEQRARQAQNAKWPVSLAALP